jgi:hypothetical protein
MPFESISHMGANESDIMWPTHGPWVNHSWRGLSEALGLMN